MPASLTASGIPHGIRTIDLLPLPQVLAAMGILTLTSIEKSGWAWAADRLRGSRIGRAWRPGRRRVLPAVTVVVMIVLLSADAARHLTWYFNVFPREVWRPFFWEENAVAKTIRERPGVGRFFIDPRSQQIYAVTLLFFLHVAIERWLRGGEVPWVERRYPDQNRLGIGEVVVCAPDDPRFRHLPLATGLVNPAGEAFADIRGPAGTTPNQ